MYKKTGSQRGTANTYCQITIGNTCSELNFGRDTMKLELLKYKDFCAFRLEGKPRLPKELMTPLIGVVGLILQHLLQKYLLYFFN